VTLKGHQIVDPFDYLFLNGEDRGIKSAGKSCPRDTLPNQGSAPSAIDGFEIRSCHRVTMTLLTHLVFFAR
jgi:hypothetical protein